MRIQSRDEWNSLGGWIDNWTTFQDYPRQQYSLQLGFPGATLPGSDQSYGSVRSSHSVEQESQITHEPIQRSSNLWSGSSSAGESVVLRGLVFDRDLNQTIEIKRIESNSRTFKTKKQAEQYGLDLCKAWVDKRP